MQPLSLEKGEDSGESYLVRYILNIESMTGNILRLMLTRGLSMIRWNNFPRVVDVTQMDNV